MLHPPTLSAVALLAPDTGDVVALAPTLEEARALARAADVALAARVREPLSPGPDEYVASLRDLHVQGDLADGLLLAGDGEVPEAWLDALAAEETAP